MYACVSSMRHARVFKDCLSDASRVEALTGPARLQLSYEKVVKKALDQAEADVKKG